MMPFPRLRSQAGFSLIEVLVAITILLVGVLGVVALVDGANAVTAKTKAREGGTNVARSIIEVGRAVPYKDLTSDDLIAALATRPGLDDALGTAGHTIESRGFYYDVSVEVCSMDDPKDNLGSEGGSVVYCAQSDHAATAADAKDRNPDDYKRIAITLTWERGGGTETTKQTSIVTNPVGGLGPSVISLTAPALSGTPLTVTSSSVDEVNFEAMTSTDAAQVNWSINGDTQGTATAVGTSERDWEFTWDIDGTGGGDYWYDCTYVVQAQAYDNDGRSGKGGALTVVLNRAQPIAPSYFEGNRNGNGDMVDLRWQANPECDVLGYRVKRRIGATGSWDVISCFEQSNTEYHEETSCLDDQAPPDSPLYYQVVAVASAAGGGLEEGATSELQVTEGNSNPDKPSNVQACLGGNPGCNGADGEAAGDGVTVISWDPSTDPDGDEIYFYRIYRDGDTYDARYDVFFPTASANLAWIDPETPDGSSHTYRVSAVDVNFRESDLSDAVVDFP